MTSSKTFDYPYKHAHGVREGSCGPHTGLRFSQSCGLYIPDQVAAVNAQAVGGVAGAAVTTWTTVTATGNQRIHFGVTPCVQVVQGTPTSATIKLRVDGFDQFGEAITEVTPTLALTNVTNNWIYLSKVFSYISRVQFQSTALDSGSDTISVGTRFDWVRTEDGSNHHVGGLNLGLGLPLRIGARELGAGGTYQLDGLPPYRVKAHDYLNWTGNAVAAETVTIDSKAYTWVAASPSSDGEVLVGGTAEASRNNLLNAINLGPGSGTNYGAATTLHPTVEARVGPSSSTQLEVRAKSFGTSGANITTAETMTAASWQRGIGVAGILLDAFENAYEMLQWQHFGFAAVGRETYSGQPANTETVTIGSTVYTFVNSLGSAFDVLIGGSTEASIDNLVAAINGGAGEGTTYGTGTTPHPTVRAKKEGTSILRVNSIGPDSSGNTIATTDTVFNADWGAAVLQGGFGHSDHSGISVEHIVLAQNEAGWEGSVDKVHAVNTEQINENWPTNEGMGVVLNVFSREPAF